jgi:dTDP-4-dehydrorhamnose 3,5-epimerase
MDVRELKIPDAYEFTPRQHRDDRGVFLEFFTTGSLTEAIGHPLHLAQANCSVSTRGTLRGIHFAQVPPGQAKYVTCVAGAGLDVVVDLRAGSPTFGAWDTVVLDETDRRAVYVAEGLGHAFLALSDNATLVYLCSDVFKPSREHGINPLDPAIGIEWPQEVPVLLSPKDEAAPTLAEAQAQGLLPSYDQTQAYYASLRTNSAIPD